MPPARSRLVGVLVRIAIGVCLGLTLPACGGAPSRVTFEGERCLIDGQTATIDAVEAEQTRLAQRVLDRAPLQTAITLVVLLFAAGTNLGRIASLLGLHRETTGPTLTERVRGYIDRDKHPRRYLAVVTLALGLVLAAGGFYLYLDADKRASERALAQLQFCHLALKSAAEQDSLDEQRKNLDAIQSTAGSIKTLVDALPPEEQRKAEALLEQMRTSLGNQQRLLVHQNLVAQAVQQGSAAIQKDLGALATNITVLKPIPERLRLIAEALARIDARSHLGDKGPATLGEALSDVRKDLADLHKALAQVTAQVAQQDCSKARLPSGKTLGEAISAIESRPPLTCPACRCEAPSPLPREATK